MKKIGEIKGVPVVEGNINEVTKNQIHYKEEGGGIQLSKRGNDNKLNSVTGSSSGGGKMEYYKLNKEKYGDENGSPLHILFRIGHIYPNITKFNDENSNIYLCAPFTSATSPETKLHDIISVWKGIAFDSNIKTYAHMPGDIEYNCDNLSELISLLETHLSISWKDDVLIPITEEEFYKLD